MPRIHFLFALLLIAVLSAVASANVIVKRQPVDVQHKTFDPANPPADMPHLKDGEAVTTSSFRILVAGDDEPLSRKKNDSGWTTVIIVHTLTLTLQLHVVVWTPQGVGEKLKAHEEGHCKIHERVYQERAIIAAKAAGAIADGKRFTGEGPDWKTAGLNAVAPAMNDLSKIYLSQTADYSDAVNDIYDELTQHGTNNKLEDEAIKEAFARYGREHPTTQPAKDK